MCVHVPDAVSMRRALQQHFQEKEDAGNASTWLSVKALTAAMTKREAARIFYQICGTSRPHILIWAAVLSLPGGGYVQVS